MWKPVITGGDKNGQVSSSENALKTIFAKNGGVDKTSHYHLIGNAQMVQEFQKGLLQSGVVPEEKVTIEKYFNHKESISNDVVSFRYIGREIRSTSKLGYIILIYRQTVW